MDRQPTQQEIADFLCKPATHAMAASPVRIDTHGSIVILAGTEAYKVKRAVSYPYMDFSTLAKRRAACEAELAVNRINAPAIYLGLVPITRDPSGALHLGGTGEVVEWAVHMRRFDEQATLDHLADKGLLTQDIMDKLAASVSDSHRAAARESGWDSVSHIQKVIAQTAGELTTRCGASRSFLPELLSMLRDTCGKAAPLLRQRAHNAHVRHCHGDLHLRNIVMIDDRPVLFDAIEFDPSLATIDTLYDLSFLVMDLCHRGLRPLACRFLTRYLWLSEDECEEIAGLALLPLFLALRACIRAEVLAAQAEIGASNSVTHDIGAYLDDAVGFLQPTPVQVIAIGGFSGSGKSLISDLLAPHLGAAPGAVQVRSDIERKRHFGVPPLTRLPAQSYSPVVSGQIYDRMVELAGLAVRAGRCVVVDATFMEGDRRRQLEDLVRQHGAAFAGIWLDAPAELLRARITSRTGDVSDATVAVLDSQLRKGTNALDWRKVDASLPPEEVVKKILAVLGPKS